MMNKMLKIIPIIAILFGIATLVSGGSVLLGSDPGYKVYAPLVMFNSGMGLVYLLCGFLIWKNPQTGQKLAGVIFLANAFVLVAISLLFITSDNIAYQSLAAMTFRSLVWLAIYLGLKGIIKH